MKDFKNGEWLEEITYCVNFYNYPDGGYGFPCTANGEPLFDQMTDVAQKNYKRCMELGPEHYPYAFNEVEEHKRCWREPNSGICECGKRIKLYNEYLGASECPHCGRWHNLFGQLLNDPSTWSRGDDW